MTITRTVVIDDLTPEELAGRFADMGPRQQAKFFAAVAAIADTWSGAGMCMQAYAIADYLDAQGKYAIERLADHAGLIPEEAK